MFTVRWQSLDGPSTCRERLLSVEAVYKACSTTGLWVTLACAVDGPSAIRREEQSYNVQRGEAKLNPAVGTLECMSARFHWVKTPLC